MNEAQVKTALAIDEDTEVIAMVESALQGSSYSLITTIDSETGIQLAKEHSPDIVLLDLTLSEAKDNALLSQLRNKQGESIPILIMTESEELYERTSTSRRHGDGYIRKPFSPADLIDAIDLQFEWIKVLNQTSASRSAKQL